MADIKLVIQEEVPVTVVEEVTTSSAKAPTTSTGKPLQDKIPSNWSIIPTQDGHITAYNNVSRESFAGSIADFNAALRA